MRTTVVVAALATFALAAAPSTANAQMRAYDVGIQGMQNKLPKATFDGATLHITTYKQLTQVKGFLLNYGKHLGSAIKAWKAMRAGRTAARLDKLKADQAYYKALLTAYQAKEKVIKPPVKAKPKEIRVIKLEELFVGPDVNSSKPVLIDMLGKSETLFRAWGSPGTKSKPSRWSAKLEFYVKYDNIATDDVVMIQVKKGRKKLGKPTPCNPYKVFSNVKLAIFECKSPKKRDWAKMYSTAGAHTIELSYKKPIEGVFHKNFATLRVNVVKLKQGAANNPYVAWGESHDSKMNVTTVEEKISQSHTGNVAHVERATSASFRLAPAFLYVRTWFKSKKGHGRSKIVCMYKGKRVAEGRSIGGKRYKYWSYMRKGSQKRIESEWEQRIYSINLLRPRPFKGKKGSWVKEPHWMNENPGDYRCVITGDGEILKELLFTVGPEGELVKPKCQLESINTTRNMTLVRTKNHKISDQKWDKKAGKTYGFEGAKKWSRACPPK